MAKQIRSKLKIRSKLTKAYYRKGQDPIIFVKFSRVPNERIEPIRNAKMSYISKSLLDRFE